MAPVKDYSSTLPYYERMLIEHPTYSRVEEVLFNFGRNGLETGKATGDDKLVEKSIKYLDKLEQLCPKSQFLPKAWLLSGEYYFAKNNLFEALKYYKKIVDGDKALPMYLYSLYKLGWTYYNYQQYDKTMACFEEVISTLRQQEKATDTLRIMSLDDYVITASEAGLGWLSTKNFILEELPPEEAQKRLELLARMMAERGYYDDSVSLYNFFISEAPYSPDAVDYWGRIFEVYRFKIPVEETEQQVRQARLFFNEDGAWMNANKGDPENLEIARDLLIRGDLLLAEFYLEGGLYFN